MYAICIKPCRKCTSAGRFWGFDVECISMGVLDTVSELFSSGEQHYRFRCDDCGTEFAQRAATVEDLSCPECGADTVRPAEAT
ncbi:rubredoxin [Haloarcula marismortui ATCC 43049]|uniref:Rubredoxin n=4 Tax=Haloarcula TaxID=2237 RepID=Q5UY59_HALMA|nr:rubredoxin [Haloarcula marismortui ATCC 43049]